MIEVEKGFILTKEQEENLINGAEFLGKKKVTDIYYDDNNYSLTTKDIWLRQRNGKFELKLPLNKSIEERVSDQYHEIENEEEIRKYFNAPADKSLIDFLKEKGYNPFCIMATKRRKYKKEGFNIDLDQVDFGYKCIDIELMVEDKTQMDSATNSIIEFAKKHNIEEGDKWGKGIEYLKRKNPVHFQALLDAKVIKL